MKSVTMRNLPPRVAQAIAARARERGISLSEAAVTLLEDAVHTGKREAGLHDLDDLAGSWSPEEASVFDEALREQRAIDRDA